MKRKNFFIVCLITLCTSCTFFDAFDDEPMFLSFDDNPEVAVDIALQGEGTEDIIGVSVFADGFNIGVFGLPADVPVLDDNDNTDISVRAVIENNAQVDNPLAYPFYAPIEFNRPFSPGETIDVEPEFNYVDGIKFLLVEDFEEDHTIIENIDGQESFVIERVSDSRSGQFSGSITTSENNPFFEKGTLNTFVAADINNTFAYLELDYKNEVPFRVGVLGIIGGTAQRVYKIQLTTTDEWKKLYLDITPEILANNFDFYKVIFSNLPGDTDFGTVQFDNIKLIIF